MNFVGLRAVGIAGLRAVVIFGHRVVGIVGLRAVVFLQVRNLPVQERYCRNFQFLIEFNTCHLLYFVQPPSVCSNAHQTSPAVDPVNPSPTSGRPPFESLPQ